MSQSSGWYQRLSGYWQLIRADRPIGIYLLLWPTLWALWLAGEGQPDWHIVLIFVLGTLLMRSAGCAINDYADRHFDGNVERTRQRPLVTGQVRPGEALAVAGLLALLAASLLWWLNTPARWQAIVAVALAAVYPFSKRYMPLPQLVLGIAFAWSIPMAFSALQGATSLLTWVLFFAVVAWTIAYDTAYAMVDREDDLKIGVQSSAILFSHYDRLVIGILQGLVIVLLGVVGWLAGRGGIYALGLVIGAGLFVYQQALLRRRERDAYFCAFLNNHPFGLVICAALVLDYWVYPTE
ncbi:MAG: 4-hydroxybenzoate octaprenyltransferase [Pseudomonadota bacterium]